MRKKHKGKNIIPDLNQNSFIDNNVEHEVLNPEMINQEDNATYQIFKGRNRNSSLYHLNGYLYSRNGDSNVSIYLNCNERKGNGCPGSAIIDKRTNKMCMKIPHNHATLEKEIKVNELRHTLLDAEGEISTKTLLQQFVDKTTPEPDDIACDLAFTSLESGMRRRRNEQYPCLPTNIEEVDTLMKSASPEMNKHYKGLLRDKNDKAIGVIFYHEELLKRMEKIKELGYDGTYFVVPEPYHQLWTIHLVSKGHFFPGLSILFTGASTDDYECAWKLLKDLLGDNFKPELAKGDFESAPKTAGEKIFLELLFSHCLFHYSQAEFRNLQKHGLQNEYESNEKFHVWMKLLMAVPLLPRHMITNAFTEKLSENIEMSTPADELKFGQFKRYVQNYWLEKDPRNLSVFEQEHCTTNGCESYHAKLKKMIVDHNPAFWVFVMNITSA